jgi:hypothetical protein
MKPIKTSISRFYLDIAENSKTVIKEINFYIHQHFSPQWGEPISLQSLRCSPFAVVHYSVRGHCLAFEATLARE